MPLNHINLVVSDVAAATKLFENYFNFMCTDVKGSNIVVVLKDTNDFTLVLMADKNGKAVYPDAFHVGFMQESTDVVIEIYKRLKKGGIAVGKEPGKIRDSFGFYFTFDTLMIEVGHYDNLSRTTA